MIKPGTYLHVCSRKIICPHCPCKANAVCNGKGFYWVRWDSALYFTDSMFAMPASFKQFQIIANFYAESLHELIEEILRDSID
jgi:hypothetical protein